MLHLGDDIEQKCTLVLQAENHCHSYNKLIETQTLPRLCTSMWLLVSHRKDWGALILVDERFAKGPHYTRGVLS